MFQQVLDIGPLFIALLVGLTYVLVTVAQVLLDPLKNVPGPLWARFTNLWYFLEIYRGRFEKTDIELHEKFGPIIRIAPHTYSIDDVEAAKIIYGHGNAFVKAPWYSAWQPPDPAKASLFSDQNPHRHGFQRRKFAASYSMSSLVGYEAYVNNCTSLLTQRFYEISKLGYTIDLQHWLQCYAFDVIGEITFGKRFGFLDMGEDESGVFQAIDTRGVYSTFVGIFPWVHGWLYPLLPKSGGHGYVYNYTLKQIEERQKALKDPRNSGRDGPPDIMTKILMLHEDNPEKTTKMDLVTMCQSNIGAGSDTTSITLSAIFHNLMKHPQTFQRLREEIDNATNDGKLSDPVKFSEAQELPYLQAVIKEALRIHPATGLPMQRLVPESGTTIAGQFIPGGSTVGINAWVAHLNQNLYGRDAKEWRPERWLEGHSGEMEKYFLAFGMGSRTCIGKNISLLEMSKVVPQLVRRFDFVLDTKQEVSSLNRWFVKQQGFRAKVVART